MGNTITGVGVLDKGVAILDAVERRPQNSTELSRELDMSVSTAHRLASALVAHGLLSRDEEGRFHLGPRFATSALAETGAAALTELRDATGETAQLWVRRGENRLCVASVESPHELRAVQPPGALIPLPLGSAGQLLAREDVQASAECVESCGTRTPGVASASAPVLRHGRVIAAVCLVGPIDRVGEHPARRYGEHVIAASRRVAAGLFPS
jgi:DNA-binding IclR family transcriptional regulator